MVIAFDFDGTVAIGAFPDIGTAVPNWPVIEWLRKRSLKGDRLLLWTCRENYGGCRYPDAPYLDDAVKFCSRVGLHVDAVNMSVGEVEGELGTRYGRKVTADFYLDDASVPFDPCSRLSGLWWRVYLKLVDRRLGDVNEVPTKASGKFRLKRRTPRVRRSMWR